MKIKTSELEGPALDWAVGKALRPDLLMLADYGTIIPWRKKMLPFFKGYGHPLKFSTDWVQGGTIIDRERINTVATNWNMAWKAYFPADTKPGKFTRREEIGDTPLIAAMRCYVASILGDEVEIPEELK